MNTMVLARLNTVWALATCRGVSAARRALPSKPDAVGDSHVTNAAS
jgi:hypothetical protein